MDTKNITDDLNHLLDILPVSVQEALELDKNKKDLIEIVLDLGRIPEARYSNKVVELKHITISNNDLKEVITKLGQFGQDNRAGIERTLHRISAIRNRKGDIIGLTCRVGRAVFGTVALVRDLLDSGQSLLLMGRPGIGKTTALREIARVLADELNKRVVIIDTSNEIAGDGDIPHPAIGRARRMQVERPENQHQVMIEAVENHMPEVIIIDEIGTELEALAARTIAERGVQLIATAHGNNLFNLIKNPTLSDLIGGIQSVTLSDEEARRRRTQKTVLERAADPTFPTAVEMENRYLWLIHKDVAKTIDLILRGQATKAQKRSLTEDGSVKLVEISPTKENTAKEDRQKPKFLKLSNYEANNNSSVVNESKITVPTKSISIVSCGITEQLLDEAIRRISFPVLRVTELYQADVLIAMRQSLSHEPDLRKKAHESQIPILVIKSNTLHQLERALQRLITRTHKPSLEAQTSNYIPDNKEDAIAALEECRLAVEKVVIPHGRPVELLPRAPRIIEMQIDLVNRYQLRSDIFGHAEQQRLRVYPP